MPDEIAVRFDRPTLFPVLGPCRRVDLPAFREMVAREGVDVRAHDALVRRAHADMSTSHPVSDAVRYVLLHAGSDAVRSAPPAAEALSPLEPVVESARDAEIVAP